MISIQNKNNCCGCNACGDVCPKGAISFQTDSEGFWYPVVDAGKCVDCGLCEKVCPIINVAELKKNDLPQSVCYAAEHKNLEVVFDSTSGGLFSALAEETYKMKAYIYILFSMKNGTLYTGVTSDLKKRIYQHKNNLIYGFTSKYNVNKLGYYEEYKDIKDAIEREKTIKGSSRKRKISLIESLNPEWKDLSEEI